MYNLISRIFGVVADWRLPRGVQGAVNAWYVRHFGIDLSRFERGAAGDYESLNALFTRRLRPDALDGVVARAAADGRGFASPCDGRVLTSGRTTSQQAWSIKGREYDARGLLGAAFDDFAVSVAGAGAGTSFGVEVADGADVAENGVSSAAENGGENLAQTAPNSNLVSAGGEGATNNENLANENPTANSSNSNLRGAQNGAGKNPSALNSNLRGAETAGGAAFEFDFCNIYLSPSDYHHYHAPCDLRVERLDYIGGRLYSVAPKWLAKIPRLYEQNERVILKCRAILGADGVISAGARGADFGARNGGANDTDIGATSLVKTPARERVFWLVFVGATNVGRMRFDFEPRVQTNAAQGNASYFYENLVLKKGAHIGNFELGSTIVVLARAGELDFAGEDGRKVAFGETLGRFC